MLFANNTLRGDQIGNRIVELNMSDGIVSILALSRESVMEMF